MKKKALVAGALGVIGRSLIQELEKQQDWEIVGISRRVPEKKGKTDYLSLDLLDRDACRKELGQLVRNHPPVLLRLPAKADLGGTHGTQPGDAGKQC